MITSDYRTPSWRPHSGERPPCHSKGRGERVWCSDNPLNWEAIMRFRTTGILWLGTMALAASAAAQTTPAPTAITRTVVAATKLPTVTDVPLYFKAVRVTLPSARRAASRRLTASSTSSQDPPRSRSKARPKCSALERFVHCRREGGGAEGGQRRTIDLPPLRHCARCGLGSAC